MPEFATNPLLLELQLNLQKHNNICCCNFSNNAGVVANVVTCCECCYCL